MRSACGNSLGATDRDKIDEYLYAVRDIETRIQKTEKENAGKVMPVFQPPSPSIPDDMAEHPRLMFDLLTLAFQTNMTRVSTMIMATEQSTRSYREIGVPEGHHGLTHHQGDKDKIEKVARINTFHVQQFAYFLNRLKSVREGEGTLLDHSMIVYGAGISDGNRHGHENLPTVLAGRANGYFKPGRQIKYAAETPMANLFVAMLNRMGAPVEQMGDSTGSRRFSGLAPGGQLPLRRWRSRRGAARRWRAMRLRPAICVWRHRRRVAAANAPWSRGFQVRRKRLPCFR